MLKRLFSIGMLLVWSVSALAQMPITSILEIRRLTPEEAGEGHSVQVEAQVVRVNPHMNHFFLNDGQYGIFVGGNSQDRSVVKGLKAGDVVRVKGKTTAGAFMSDIQATTIQVLGNKPRPEPAPIYNTDFVSTGNDCKWGWLRGRLFSIMISEDKTSILLDLVDVDSEEYVVHLPYTEENEQRLREFMFSFLELKVVCGTVANENRQMIGRIFYAHSAEDFSLTGAEWQLNTMDVAEIHELMRCDISFNRPFQTRGVVLYASKREMYLRGEKACLKVSTADPVTYEPGDEVSLTGFIWVQPVSPAFRAGKTELVGKKEQPHPVPMDLTENLDQLKNYDLVQLDAELVEVKKNYVEGGVAPQYLMRCRSDGEFFEARLPAGIELDEQCIPGALLRLSGICNMQREMAEQLSLEISGFWLQLRNNTDIQILKRAPWWTTGRLLTLLSVVLVITLASIAWILMLRRTVEHQTRIIAEKLERESIMDERQRIARELHDNLEQGLAGAIFQLGGIRRVFKKNIEKNQKLLQGYMADGDQESLEQLSEEWPKDSQKNLTTLEAVENMLSYCSVESRSSILDLRGGLLEKMNLVDAVGETLRRLDEEGGPKLKSQVIGHPDRYELATERNILLMIKEAVTNAIRHAQATRIDIVLDYAEGLKASVADDGCGFDVEAKKRSGRFGLKGMQERIQNINGTLAIESVEGNGTVVVAEIKNV